MLKKKALKEVHLSRSLRIYQKASVAFVIFSFFLLLAVLYLSVSRATIHVEPTPLVKEATASFVVTPSPQLEGEVSGYVIERSETKSKLYPIAKDGAVEVEAKARGFVTLVNETSNPQPLVATTRLLSESGVLFRIVSPTVVPANGEVVVEVAADKIGATGNIEPTKFTIPGLGTSLQAKIYGVSLDPMIGGIEYQRVVTEDDIAQARTLLENELVAELKERARMGIPVETFNGESIRVTIDSVASSVQPGETVGAIPVQLTAKVVAVYYDKASISAFVNQALESKLEEGYALVVADLDGLKTEVKGVDPVSERATIEVTLTGVAAVDETHPLFDRDRFIGKAEKDVVAILSADSDIKDVSISFSPFWIKRMPTLKDHIDLRIKEPSEPVAQE